MSQVMFDADWLNMMGIEKIGSSEVSSLAMWTMESKISLNFLLTASIFDS